MVVELAKVSHEFLLSGGSSIDEILVRKGNDLALGDEIGEFILFDGGERAELDSLSKGAQTGLNRLELDARLDQVGEGLVVDSKGWVFERKGRERLEPDLVEVGEIVWILC